MLRMFAWTLALMLVVLPVVAVVNGWIGAERFEQALQHAIFATAVVAVEDVEDPVVLLLHQRRCKRGNAVDRMRIDTARA
jgi:hypothetical protein